MNGLTHTRREIEAAWRSFVVDGRVPPSVRPGILRSWQRARTEWNVDPALRTCPGLDRKIAPSEAGDRAFRIGLPLVRQFADQLASDGHVVAFFDARGVMLGIEGNHRTRNRLADVNFAPGACWAESAAGTNGPGTSLAEQRAVEVFASEHFVEAWQPWTCASAPVCWHGAVIGAVDITSPWDAYNPALLLTTEALAKTIEAQLDAATAQRQNAMLWEVSQEAVRARDAVLAVAAHELRTPLTPLHLKLQVIERLLVQRGAGVDPEELIEALQGADKQVQRLAEFIDDMVEVSAAADEQPQLVCEPTDLAALAQRVVERNRSELEQHGCRVTVTANGDVVGRWDTARLEHALRQLLLNAMKYAPGPVEVVVDADPFTARLLVRDRGHGIPSLDRERLFLPYERGVSHWNVSGFGLGLHVVRQIVEAHGGEVRLEGDFGQGSTFVIELPLT